MLKEMIKKRALQLIAGLYIIAGIVGIINSLSSITGLVIYENISPKLGSLLGIIFLALGILVLIAVREKESILETRLAVYNSRKGRTKDENYMMTDPELYFENSGAISLGRFKREINALREGQSGEELVKLVKDEYEPFLEKIAESEDRERSMIAIEFLKVIDPKYQTIITEHHPREEDYSLTREQREEIKNAFRSYDGRVTTEQKAILRKYNLIFDNTGGGEAKIRYPGIGYTVTVSKTPSDLRAGLNLVVNIKELIEKGRKHDLEKKSKQNQGRKE